MVKDISDNGVTVTMQDSTMLPSSLIEQSVLLEDQVVRIKSVSGQVFSLDHNSYEMTRSAESKFGDISFRGPLFGAVAVTCTVLQNTNGVTFSSDISLLLDAGDSVRIGSHVVTLATFDGQTGTLTTTYKGPSSTSAPVYLKSLTELLITITNSTNSADYGLLAVGVLKVTVKQAGGVASADNSSPRTGQSMTLSGT